MDGETMEVIRAHVAALAAMEYPKVWVGQAGMTADELLALQELNDRSPEGFRIEPGDFAALGDTGHGVQIPGPSVDWLDGLYVVENIRDELPEGLDAELHREVLYIYAAKRGEVPVFRDGRERYEAGLPPEIKRVAVDALTSEELPFVNLDELEFFAIGETMGPYVIEESERARAAVEERLQG